jgi:hypothetical protein
MMLKQGSWEGIFYKESDLEHKSKIGNTHAARREIPTVILPSMMNSHLHPAIPCAPSRFPRTPAPIRPPNALARELPA